MAVVRDLSRLPCAADAVPGEAQHAEGVAGILDIMELVAPLLGIFVLIGAVSSQLSAAIADSIGSGGLMVEVSRRKLERAPRVHRRQRAGDRGRLADRSLLGDRAVVARVRPVLRDAGGSGLVGVYPYREGQSGNARGLCTRWGHLHHRCGSRCTGGKLTGWTRTRQSRVQTTTQLKFG